MSNVVSLDQSCDYLVERAQRHSRAGRYDEAMALLTKARGQFGPQEAVEYALAGVYEAMDCVEAASRAYLRVVRLRGVYQAKALFQLALLAAARSDTMRALSYFHRYADADRNAVPEEAAMALYDELAVEENDLGIYSRQSRAAYLERRAVDRLREGKLRAAKRTLSHALALRPSAQGYTLLACCALLQNDGEEAVRQAKRAHALAPASVQTLCVLADAYYLANQENEGRRATMLAALRAKSPQDLLAAAMESAKHGDDKLTLRLTTSLLHREPFNTRGMQLRACALTNAGRLREASRLFGRLCGLLPEDTVCEYYYRLTREGVRLKERLSLGLEVPRAEAAERAMRLVGALYEQGESLAADTKAHRSLCRLCEWALRSPLAGEHVTVAALMLLGSMNSPDAQEVLLDALVDPQLSDSLKRSALQVLTSVSGVKPYDVDLGGQFVCVAAGGMADRQVGGEKSSRPVQMACDALMRDFPDAPRRLLPLWIGYLNAYGPAKGRFEAGCAAALEYAYHEDCARQVSLKRIARRNGVSPRLCRVCLRRIRSAQRNATAHKTDEATSESRHGEE